MANLTPTPGWDNVAQLEISTPALGGPGGSMNQQAQALLNRTEWLNTFVQQGAGAVSRTTQNKLRESVSVHDFGAVGDGVTDDSAAINLAIAKIAADGGGVVVFPYTVGGYKINEPITVSSSNITLELHGDIKMAKTVATSASYVSAIRVIGTTVAYIENVSIIAPSRKVKIDGNARNVVGFTHTPGANSSAEDHHAVLVRFAKNIRIHNLYAYNGLIGCITTAFCLGGVITDCDASHSVYDNGTYIFDNGEHIIPLDQADPNSWSNVRGVNLRAWNCANHGIGTYGAVGVTFVNPKVWNCGNNTGTAGAGPAGGLGFERGDGDPDDFNYRLTAICPEVYNSFGYGIRTNCAGTRVVGGKVFNTQIPTNYTDSVPPLWGSGVFVQHVDDCHIECDIYDCGNYGLRAQGASGKYAGVDYSGTISGCGQKAVYGVGVSYLRTSPESVFENNGHGAQTVSDFCVDITNQALNTNAGEISIAGRFNNNYGGVVQAASLGVVDLTKGISGSGNGAAWVSAFHAIYIPSCVTLQAANINLFSAAAKHARVLKCDGSTTAIIDRASILGSHTNGAQPKAEVVATTLIGDKVARITYDPPSVAANSYGVTYAATVTGAAVGDIASVACMSGALIWSGAVTAANTVSITPYNATGSAIDLGEATFHIRAARLYGQ